MTNQESQHDAAEITGETLVGDAAHATLASRMAMIRWTLPQAARDSEQDVEHVHQLRVATRRMAAALSIFQSILGPKQHRKTRKMLKSIRRTASDARVCDVQILELAKRHYSAASEHQRILEELIAHLTKKRARAQRAICAAMDDYSEDRITRREEKLLASMDLSSPVAMRTLAAHALEIMPPLVADLREQGKTLDTIEQLHELRLAGKKIRYALEVLTPCYEDTSDAAKRFRRLQNALGSINDTDEILMLLRMYRQRLKKKRKKPAAASNAAQTDFSQRLTALKALTRKYEEELDTKAYRFVTQWQEGTWTDCLDKLTAPPMPNADGPTIVVTSESTNHAATQT